MYIRNQEMKVRQEGNNEKENSEKDLSKTEARFVEGE